MSIFPILKSNMTLVWVFKASVIDLVISVWYIVASMASQAMGLKLLEFVSISFKAHISQVLPQPTFEGFDRVRLHCCLRLTVPQWDSSGGKEVTVRACSLLELQGVSSRLSCQGSVEHISVNSCWAPWCLVNTVYSMDKLGCLYEVIAFPPVFQCW